MHKNKFDEAYLSFFIPFFGLIQLLQGKKRIIYLLGFFVNLIVCILLLYFMGKYLPILLQRFTIIGKKPICNLKEERAIHIGSFVFIFCYRCTFLIIGIFSSFFCYYLKRVKLRIFYVLFSIIFIIPCLLDGLFQLLTEYTSTNFLRAITGLFAGIGIGYFAYFPFARWNLYIKNSK